ncbi:NtaA/DmoA family FMN-dependent monooxygenase [Streptomyces halstedii]|uniref:NtaA/DmoA family FMN-dependent monooxygenase n=2 Tax=Streptomyces halstedii TaxID=1944 RepID=A0ABS6U0F3_STRHA|nr:NtaA/DmoA family FMN-dependent monooxygenase [Streptomyces halstedii]
MRLAVRFPGADSTTVRDGPRSGSETDFSSLAHLARTAERGKFDFFFLAGDGPRPREHHGRAHHPDVAGRPEALTLLGALAAVTDRLGLAATVDATYNEPYVLARRLATLDHLSGGRAAWQVLTCPDAPAREDLRRGGHPDRAERYARAAEFVTTARELWDSWTPEGTPRPFAHTGRHFAISGEFTVPRSPQGHPVVLHSGDFDEGREFAASAADVVLTRHRTLEDGQAFYADVKARLAAYGRRPDDLTVMAGVTVVLGDTDAEAQENAAAIRRLQVSARNALPAPEQVRGRGLSPYGPDGPPPGIDPGIDPGPEPDPVRGGARNADRPRAAATRRALSEAKGLSVRRTAVEATTRPSSVGSPSFVGSPETVATALEAFVTAEAADGFVLVPHLAPGGLDDFVDRVVPLLQERGSFRSAYTGTTLRSHLGHAEPVWKG